MKAKSLLISCLSVAMLTGVLVGCNKKEADVTPTGVTLDVTTKTLKVGSTFTLNATVLPANATDKTITWSTSSAEVATVSEKGVVTAVKSGTANITVTTKVGAKTATCALTVQDTPLLEDLAVVAPVQRNDSFVSYDNNKKEKPANKREEFIDRSQAYVVGTDNSIKIKPDFDLVDINTLEPYDSSLWTYDFKFTISEKTTEGTFTPAQANLFTVVNAKTCELQFAKAAEGKTFKIDICPGGLDATDEADPDFHAVQEVKVEEGYNVYTADELAYFDTRHGNNHEELHGGDVVGWNDQWDAFKEAKGLSKTLQPKALHLQKALTITKDNIPSNFIYTAEELKTADDPDSVGTLKDYVAIYDHWTDGEFKLNGNYFTVNYSSLPLVNRFEGAKTAATGNRNSHSMLFRIGRGDQTIENVSFIGNSKNATTDDDKKYSGGLMLYKIGMMVNTFHFTNSISIQTYIQVMCDDLRIVADDGKEIDPTKEISKDPYVTYVTNVKGFDNYNCFLYNWGEKLYVKTSEYSGCGGPILIQDHRGTDATEHPCESVDEHGNYTILESPSKTVFDNCDLENYVMGSEAWFIQMDVTSLVTGIKAMSDLFYTKGLSYVVDENKNPVPTVTGGKKLFNFIAVNKSSSAEGLTQIPVCGQVLFIDEAGNESFTYAEPTTETYQLLGAIKTALTALNGGDVATFTAIATQLGYTDPNPLVNADNMIADMKNLSSLKHEMIRGINANGGPVFQCGGENYAFFDNENQYLQSINNQIPGLTPSTDELPATDDFFTKAGQHVGLYFMGMMLVFGLKKVTL